MAAPPRLQPTTPVPCGSGSGGGKRVPRESRRGFEESRRAVLKTWPATPVLLPPPDGGAPKPSEAHARAEHAATASFLKGSSRGRPAIRRRVLGAGCWVLGFGFNQHPPPTTPHPTL